MIGRGRVNSGSIILDEPLALPEGTPVVVQIEAVAQGTHERVRDEDEELTALPFFGMWADRADMADSAGWVCDERERS
jgi:hypothetical protein